MFSVTGFDRGSIALSVFFVIVLTAVATFFLDTFRGSGCSEGGGGANFLLPFFACDSGLLLGDIDGVRNRRFVFGSVGIFFGSGVDVDSGRIHGGGGAVGGVGSMVR